MTDRDSFAMAALNGLLSDPGILWWNEKTKTFDTTAIRINCDLAYLFADEMTVARERMGLISEIILALTDARNHFYCEGLNAEDLDKLLDKAEGRVAPRGVIRKPASELVKKGEVGP